ncbi:PRC-barrel domain-containing protein [Serpentinicella sp. ANB-PHB4]|uniref:PRC-barrel domain-containing protein n=1 Tax=Serpentinicella sp. ANB-PHB4 TaxID=3074076 RepID=UPI00285FA68D|nr:PRC-barrel domain-containing protein [Serpentinicella sp. ANB-PHB4]MDR5658099.1 PRC-barrel domain-containing protein [Serpentinicella sp. ANB-PHB4]
MRISEVIGLKVLNKNNQIMPYFIKEPIYSYKNLSVVAFLVQHTFISKDKEKILCYNKILNFTNNGVITLNAKSLIGLDQRDDILKLYKNPLKLSEFEIYTKDGELVGIVRDAIINQNNGKVDALIIHEGFFTNMYNGYSVLVLSENSLLEEATSNKLIIKEEDKDEIYYEGGGIKKILRID